MGKVKDKEIGVKDAYQSKGNIKFFQGKEESSVIEKQGKKAFVISRLDHPVTLSYGGECIIIPPRGRELINNYEMLGALPKGVSVVPKI